MVVVMLGDSLTAGFGLPESAALPARVEARLNAAGVRARVVNAGVSGDTTADGLNRYEWSVAAARPDLLVLALGANDYLNDLPPEAPRRNLAAIIDRARADGIGVVLLGLTLPEGEGALPEREAAYLAIAPDLAAQYSLPILASMLNGVAGRPELLQPDGLHPTAEGVDLVAAEVAAFLSPIAAAAASAD